MKRDARLPLVAGVAALAATLATQGGACGMVVLVEPVVVRVDGTTLADWTRNSDLESHLASGAAATLLLPRTISDATRHSPSTVPPWYDAGLGGRRRLAATLVAHGTRTIDPARGTTPTGSALSQEPAGIPGRFFASSPDARPIAIGGTVVSALREDERWPTGGRVDIDPARAVVRAGGPIEVDVSDAWRLEHARLSGPARDAHVDDMLATIVAPLITDALGAGRSVLLVSLLPPVGEQRSERWHGAVAVLGANARGLLHSPVLPPSIPGEGIARGTTLPGTIDVSRLLGAVGLIASDAEAARSDTLCATGGSGADAASAARNLIVAADAHDTAATVLAFVLVAAVLAAAALIAGYRRAPNLRTGLTIVSAAALLLPVAATIESLTGAGPAVRATLLLATLAVAALLAGNWPARTALAFAAGAGAFASALGLLRGGSGFASSILAAPLLRGIRTEGIDAFLVAAFAVTTVTVLAHTIDASGADRPLRALLAVPFGGVVLVAATRGDLPVGAAVALALVIAAPVMTVFARTIERGLFLTAAATLAAGTALASTLVTPLSGVEDALFARAAAQPLLWPLLAFAAGLLVYFRYRLAEGHGDVLARASFGSPAWRVSELALLAAAPLLGVAIGAGAFAAFLLVAVGILVGRTR